MVGTLMNMRTKALTMGFHHDKPVAAIADKSMSQLKVLLGEQRKPKVGGFR